MLEAYDYWMGKDIQRVESEIVAIRSFQQHPALASKRQGLLDRKREKYLQRRVVLEQLLKEGKLGEAKEQFERETGHDYVPIALSSAHSNSPKKTMRRRTQTRVMERGGPVHPNLLPSHMVNRRGNKKTVKNEHRYMARLPNRRS